MIDIKEDEEIEDEASEDVQRYDSDNEEFGRSEEIDLDNVDVGSSSKPKQKAKPIISKAEAEQIIAMSDKLEKKKAKELNELKEIKLNMKTEQGLIEALKFKMRIFDYHYDFPTDTMTFFEDETLLNPTLEELYYFCKYVIISGRMEKEIPILCLIYLERFFTKTGILMNYGNWKRLTLISLILASKIWDDDSLENVHFP
jgi:hypothetical protein